MSKYHKVQEELSASLLRSRADPEVCEFDDLNIVVLSDLHRGKRNRADDFRKCERAYLSALTYYDQLESHLILLGDIEELWETSIKKTIASYSHVLEAEKNFIDAGRYTRLIGNHDEKLVNPKHFAHLSQYVNGVPPLDALSINVLQQGEPLGELFFAHGHQGKKYSKLDKWAVKYLWTGFQRFTGLGSSWPSKNYEVRNEHEKAMYEWSVNQSNPIIFICGHTHRPVFMSSALKQFMINELKEMKKEGAPAEKIAHATAKLQWVLLDPMKNSSLTETPSKPSYFNTGCCSFADGDITGIEISNGQIRLVKWGDSREGLQRIELRASDLLNVLTSC